MKKSLFFAFLLLACSTAFAQTSRLISFKDAEELALKNSPQILAQQFAADSAYQQAEAQKLQRFPTLSLNAQSMFMSKVGKIEIPSMGITNTVGSHTNWSVSPTLNFVVWDTGQILKKAKSLRFAANAQTELMNFDKRQVLLAARSAYVGVALAKEQVRLVKESLALAKAQYAYVSSRFQAGSSDKFDLTVAHQEMTDREKDLEQAEGELLVSKRALAAALAIEDEITKAEEIDVEPIFVPLNALSPKTNVVFNADEHPQVKALTDQSLSAQYSAKSIFAKYFPEITLKGSAGYEYPNLGQNETTQQNRLTLGLSMPIFDWGRIWQETKSQKFQAKSADEQKRQTKIDLVRDVSETRDWIETFKKLQKANDKVVKDAVEVARLSFDSYKIGRVIFLDVQRANVKELSAKVDAARNDANLTVQIAKLLALAMDEGDLK